MVDSRNSVSSQDRTRSAAAAHQAAATGSCVDLELRPLPPGVRVSAGCYDAGTLVTVTAGGCQAPVSTD